EESGSAGHQNAHCTMLGDGRESSRAATLFTECLPTILPTVTNAFDTKSVSSLGLILTFPTNQGWT
ncbi:MAG: hypothetical protein ACO2Z1_01895, partial [Pontimonas sp.]